MKSVTECWKCHSEMPFDIKDKSGHKYTCETCRTPRLKQIQDAVKIEEETTQRLLRVLGRYLTEPAYKDVEVAINEYTEAICEVAYQHLLAERDQKEKLESEMYIAYNLKLSEAKDNIINKVHKFLSTKLGKGNIKNIKQFNIAIRKYVDGK